ncbi:MAG: zf-HC2 domain-containing protein [Proteobacteria bacterium]|nr:zf-HC2 domain-containing protein [Pseudomonadota bacterium]MBU4469898.1 zf-HC2 domain-containing protein [Pseudomonadota bacterium]MCG2751584.1 zf-HC2 domain-containing protein [Desulfobacteraceae bacterium]
MIKGCIKEEDLSAFTDGELSGPKIQRVEEHLENCLECREKLAEMKASDGLFRSFAEVEPSADFDRSFWKKVRELDDTRGKARWFRLPWGLPRPVLASGFAAGFAVLLVFALVFNKEAGQPVEKEEVFMAEHMELLNEFELIQHLDLLEDWETIKDMKENT